jgi:hypothetical protein
VINMGEMRNAYEFVVGNTYEKRPLGMQGLCEVSGFVSRQRGGLFVVHR